MSRLNHEQTRDYLKRRQQASPELQAILRRQLREYDFKKNRRAIASLFQLGTDCRVPRKSSGLVEWYQRLGLDR